MALWWVNGDLLQEAYATGFLTQVSCTQSPCPCGRPLLTCTSAGDTQTLKGRSGSVSVGSLGPGVNKFLFEPSECLWRIWGLILNEISPSYHLAGASPLPVDVGYLFLLGSDILLLMVVQHFSSVAQSCLTLCNPMDCSRPGLPVHHQPPEYTQTHVH